MRLVIAHPSQTYVEQLQDALEALGHIAEIATNAVDCLQRIRSTQPDIVALSSDLIWGSSEGILSIMQEEPQFQNIPVLLVTDTMISQRIYQHPMVTSSIHHLYPLEDITNQLTLLDLIYNGTPSLLTF